MILNCLAFVQEKDMMIISNSPIKNDNLFGMTERVGDEGEFFEEK